MNKLIAVMVKSLDADPYKLNEEGITIYNWMRLPYYVMKTYFKIPWLQELINEMIWTQNANSAAMTNNLGLWIGMI